MNHITRYFKTVIILAIILFVGFVIWARIDIYTYAQRTETRSADAAIVLGAAVFGDQPSPVFRERINHAILLYEQGYVDIIIFTGGLGNGDLTEGDVSARYAAAQGVPPEAILIENKSTNTLENLMNAQKLAGEHGLQTFLIVSTPFHMKRAMSIADDLGMTAFTSPTRTIQWISWVTKSRAFVQEVISYAVYLTASRCNVAIGLWGETAVQSTTKHGTDRGRHGETPAAATKTTLEQGRPIVGLALSGRFGREGICTMKPCI